MDSGGGGSDVRLTSFVVDHHDTTQNDVSCINIAFFSSNILTLFSF